MTVTHSAMSSHDDITSSSSPTKPFVHSNIDIELIPCLSDNYAYLLIDKSEGVAAVIDPSESKPVIRFLSSKGLKLAYILNTHHHHDHTGGNLELKNHYGAQVIGPKADESRIPGIDLALQESDTWQFSGHKMNVLDTPGHTRGHVTFYFESLGAVFTGDTLFSLGCGRLFEGTAKQMWNSLSKITSLPPQTHVFCGHEYTQSNALFAYSLEPKNPDLIKKIEKITSLRNQNLPTIPVLLSEELRTNPFLRPYSEEIKQNLSLPSHSNEADVFAAVRKAKDVF